MEIDRKSNSASEKPPPIDDRTERGNTFSIPKAVESLFAKIFLVLASFAICIIAIEVVARFYLWNLATEDEFRALASINQIKDRYGDDIYVQEVDKRQLSWSPHHFLGHFPTPNYRRGENIHNSYGFRGEEFEIAKPQNTFRIVAVGGSTTYSIDVQNYRNSYPDLLEQYLRANGFDHVEILNAGATEYTSNQNLINLQLRVLPLQPDLVIVYQGFNDIRDRFVYPHSRYWGDGAGAVRPFVRDIFMPDIAEYSAALRILGIRAGITTSHAALDWHFHDRPSSYYGASFDRQVNTGKYPDGIFEELPAAEMLANNPPVHFERNLKNMVAAAAVNRVSMLLITMVVDDDFHETSGSSKNRFFNSDEYVFALAQHNDITRRLASVTDTPVFDLAAAFPDDAALFTDGLHMNEEGNRMRAQLIGDFVISRFSDDMKSTAP